MNIYGYIVVRVFFVLSFFFAFVSVQVVNASQSQKERLVYTVPYEVEKDVDIQLTPEGVIDKINSGIFIWNLGLLFINLDEDRIYYYEPYGFRLIVSEKKQEKFDFKSWKDSIINDSQEVIKNEPYGLMYKAEGVVHIVTYRYENGKHVIGKGMIFDGDDLIEREAAYEILYSLTLSKEEFNEYRNITRAIDYDELIRERGEVKFDFNMVMSRFANRNIKPEYLIEKGVFSDSDSSVDYFSSSEEIGELTFQLHENDRILDAYIESSKFHDFKVLYSALNEKGKTKALLLRSIKDDGRYYSYCFHDVGGVFVRTNLLQQYQNLSLITHVEHIKACMRLKEKNLLLWLKNGFVKHFDKYKYVKKVDSNMFLVSDYDRNPNDFFFGAKGVVDINGDEVIPIIFEELKFENDLFFAKGVGGEFIFDSEGIKLVEGRNIRALFDGYYLVDVDNDLDGVYSIKDKGWAVKPRRSDIEMFSGTELIEINSRENLNGCVVNGCKGLMNLKGEVILPEKNNWISFNSNLNMVVAQRVFIGKDGKKIYRYGVFNIQGEQIVPFEYDYVRDEFLETIWLRKEGLWYGFDSSGFL